MRIARVYVQATPKAGERFVIGGDAASHLARVLRLTAGDSLVLFDGRGNEYPARIAELRKSAVSVEVLEQRAPQRESPLPVTLAQGLCRGERMDFVIQKATELGVARIIPVLSERTVVRLDAARAHARLQHWRAVAISACEQCGRNQLPEITEPVGIPQLAATLPAGGERLLLSPLGTTSLAEIAHARAGIIVLIGPEGGLAESEEQLCVRSGFRMIRLGPRILRTETAALAALAVLQARWGDLV